MLIVAHLIKNFLTLYRTQGSLLCTQDTATGTYSDAFYSTRHSHSNFLRSTLILSSRLCKGLTSGLSRSLLKPKQCMNFLLTMRAICVASLIAIYLVEWHAAEYKSYISSLSTSCQPSITYFTLRPNILLNTVLCNTHISFSSLNIRVQVLHLNDRQIYTS